MIYFISDRYPLSESNFYDILINHFLTSPDGMIFKQDIVLNATGGIVVSCFLFQIDLIYTIDRIVS